MSELEVLETHITNLPNYTVRESQKAKNIRLKVSVKNGVEVTIPKGFDQNRLPSILQKKQVWLEAAIKHIEEQRRFFERQPPVLLPEDISLNAIGEHWQVEYHSTSESVVISTEKQGGRLIVSGNINDVQACKSALLSWLARKAHSHLVPWLKEVSQMKHLPYGKTLVKGQKTRWASCSLHKTISINYKLLFIPAHLVYYVFIHELCHTIQMNHSCNFWDLVNEKEPNYKQLDTELRDAWYNIPIWVERDIEPKCQRFS